MIDGPSTSYRASTPTGGAAVHHAPFEKKKTRTKPLAPPPPSPTLRAAWLPSVAESVPLLIPMPPPRTDPHRPLRHLERTEHLHPPATVVGSSRSSHPGPRRSLHIAGHRTPCVPTPTTPRASRRASLSMAGLAPVYRPPIPGLDMLQEKVPGEL